MATQSNGLEIDDWESIDDLQLNNQLDQLKSQQKQQQLQNGTTLNGSTSSFLNDEEFRPKILQRPANKIQILKRPNSGSNLAASASTTSSASSSVASINEKPKHLKTLEQREKEYYEARLRILGSTSDNPGEDFTKNLLKPNINTSPNSSYTLNAQQQLQNAIKLPDNVIRNPRGPDGTNGFKDFRR